MMAPTPNGTFTVPTNEDSDALHYLYYRLSHEELK